MDFRIKSDILDIQRERKDDRYLKIKLEEKHSQEFMKSEESEIRTKNFVKYDTMVCKFALLRCVCGALFVFVKNKVILSRCRKWAFRAVLVNG